VADRDPRVGTDDKAAAATTWRKQEMRRPRVAVRGGEMIEQALGLALPGFNRTVPGPSRARPRPYHGPTQWANMAFGPLRQWATTSPPNICSTAGRCLWDLRHGLMQRLFGFFSIWAGKLFGRLHGPHCSRPVHP
jgi:hypothetical protein